MRNPPFRINPPYTPEFLSKARFEISEFLASGCDRPRVFEYGAGCSTPWFAMLDVELISIEHNRTWFTEVNRVLDDERLYADVRFCENVRMIDREIDGLGLFDLVLIDCEDMERLRCIKRSAGYVKSGGLLVVDDSNWPIFASVGTKILKGWQETVLKTLTHTRKDGQVTPHQTTLFRKPS